MILHIIDDEKFLVSIIELFETIYSQNNVFLVGVDKIGYNDFEKLKLSTNIVFKKVNTEDYQREYINLSRSANLVLFHNVYKTYKLKLLQKNAIHTKTAWFFWGAELYGLNPRYNALLPETKKAYLKSLSKKQFIKKTTLSKLKKQYYWNLFKTALKQNKLQYTLTNIDEDVSLLEHYTQQKLKKGWFTYYYYNDTVKSNVKVEKKHILIGNSSSESNNHLDAFNLLKDTGFQNKKVYIPLNYGDEKYRELVIKQSRGVFGDCAVPLTEFLTLNEYTGIINSCAVLIMNHRRQQAFNTIMIALANGCKVFLRQENTIYKMLKREGFVLFSIQEDIDNPGAFNSLTQEQQDCNLQLIQKLYNKHIVFGKIKVEIQKIMDE
ncbi:TDP-N-acetylfucosamine:lipid II N-acetylfucosaminyltransferase [Cellulophaga lytica]|uniref:TDP-N-acetylfucosamine:lipid II N-acetylfucosaminyltransferase n=1 Tax=Cellulophaga lytica TaxID=979 RepID=UPI0032E4785F